MWLEPKLDNMPPSERSRFIREAIIEKLGQSDVVLQSVTKSDEVTRHTSDVTQSQTPVESDDFVVVEKDVDLDDILDNMFKGELE